MQNDHTSFPAYEGISNRQPACRGIFGWLFGHSFSPRYSTETLVPKELPELMASCIKYLGDPDCSYDINNDTDEHGWRFMDLIMEGFKDTREERSSYLGDVCKRCGAKADNPPRRDPAALAEMTELTPGLRMQEQ